MKERLEDAFRDALAIIYDKEGKREGTVVMTEDEGSLILGQFMDNEFDVLVLEDHQIPRMIEGMQRYLRDKGKPGPQ
jgi:hypothetical protein